MNKEEVAKLIESIPQGLDQDDFLVALATKAAEIEREACCGIVTGLCISDNNAEQINKTIRARSK